ncbi:DUF4124 domain-containing protein [Salinisphaera sp. SPP-AMP-43]|uniref:DUF4124 domain-containing protein n=1 Tax=Salinisphaera sp. SPP-AMP-43 TaxID=3121288 RepID=UPI003C6E63FF
MRGVGLLIALIGGLLTGPAGAAIYTWIDDQGIRHYSDTKQAADARITDLANTRARHPPDEQAATAPRSLSPASNTRVLKLVRPQDGEVFHGTHQGVPVLLAGREEDRLEAGETLTYRLDGQVLGKSPTRATRLRLTGIAPGPHRLDVALNYRGHEIRLSGPVRFTVAVASSTGDLRPAADPVPPPS